MPQHAGPKLATYSTGNPTAAASALLAHRSRLFTMRTVSQTQNAAKATARAGRTIVMPCDGAPSDGAPIVR